MYTQWKLTPITDVYIGLQQLAGTKNNLEVKDHILRFEHLHVQRLSSDS